jgi:hypothetical protein
MPDLGRAPLPSCGEGWFLPRLTCEGSRLQFTRSFSGTNLTDLTYPGRAMMTQGKEADMLGTFETNEINYLTLLIGMLMTLLVSLSVHVVMLQVLHVPFPEFAGVSIWASFLNMAGAVLAMMLLCSAARPRLALFSKVSQCIIVFLLYVMLKETFRGILMNGVVTTAWRFDLVAGLPSLTYGLILTTLLVIVTPLLGSIWAKGMGAGVITAVAMFVLRPALSKAFAPFLKAAQHFDHDEIYSFPYGWHVLLPAYVTYAEPVIACMLIAVLVWHSLSTKPVFRLVQFCMLILLIRGMLFPSFVYSFYSKAKLPIAMLSQSQFLFETVSLAVLTALVWQLSARFGATEGKALSQ